MTKLTKELIEETLKKCDAYHGAVTAPVSVDVVRAMAHQLLASMEQAPVYLRPFGDDGETFVACDGNDERAIPLYAAPQLPQPAVVAMKDHQIRDLVNELRNVAVEYHGTQQLRERIARTVRAAMLQGAEPVSQTYTLRDGIAAIRSLGPIDAGKIQAERDALNEPTCWCHTCRPVTMNDARFVMCPDCGNKRCPHANDHRNTCTGSNEPGQEGSAYPAAPQQE